ncbi:MAG: hypothetical protein J0L61_10950 [Planctomycetes bacterium]|nr:hypothetical protein [Planctomycetota bacterium]
MKTRLMTAATLALASAAPALAGFTSVNPAPGSELSHAPIINNVYGGTFALNESAVPTYTNNTGFTLTRVSDFGLGGVMSIVGGSAATDDQAWSRGDAVGPVTVIARAKYAGDSHTIGWIDDTSETPVYQSILGSTNFNNPVAVTLSSSFRWALNDITTGKTWTSRASDNVKSSVAYDQLVTYRVTGPTITQPTFLLFWEDRIGSGADYDYNDAVFEITAVPTPGVASLFGFAALAGARRRR